MNKKTDIATGRKIQENKEIKKAEEAAEKADEESARMHSRRITASWLMEIIKHLYIAAYSLDGDTVANTEKYWRTEDMGVITSDWESDAEINLSDAYHHLLFSNPHMEQFLESVTIIPEPKHLFDNFDVIRTYLPDDVIHDIIAIKKESNKDKESQEEKSMSFAGVMLLDDCIMAFGDSKGTQVDASGNKYEETGRAVQKVFRYDDCLLVTSGLNEVSFNDSTMRIEDYINDCISRHIPLHDMLNMLTSSWTLEEASRLNVGGRIVPYGYQFIVGGFDLLHNAPYVTSIYVDADGVKERPRKYKQEDRITEIHSVIGVYHHDFEWFISQLDDSHKTDYDAFLPELQKWFAEETRKADRILDYNSVGLPLQIEILRN